MSDRFIALVVTCLGVCQSLAAQSRWDRQVDARITQAAATLQGRAYRLAGLVGRGTLNTGESATFSITLPAGTESALTGVCDDDCADLDLSLSTHGYDIDAARGGGNAPIVRATPATPTTYTFTVHMASCHVNPCWFAVAVFRQALRLGIRHPGKVELLRDSGIANAAIGLDARKRREPVRVDLGPAQDVQHVVAARQQRVGDELAMAAPRDGLSAHHCRA